MPVTVSDVREEATAPFREGARVAATPPRSSRSDVVLVVVFNDAQVRAVLRDPTACSPAHGRGAPSWS